MAERTDYLRRLGFWDSVMVVIGAVIGAGIFRNPQVVAAQTGSLKLIVIAWTLGGAISMAGSFCFAELGARFPQAGGSYVFLREGSSRLAAFLQGWTLLVLNGSSSVAAVARMTGEHLTQVLGLAPQAVSVVAVSAILILTGINCLGVEPGARTQTILTILKIGILILVIAVGFAPSHVGVVLPPVAVSGEWYLRLMHAMGPVMWAYGGWQMVTFLAAEIRDPTRLLPRVLVAGTTCTLCLYLAVNAAYVSALGVSGLAATTTPAVVIMERTLGWAGQRIIMAGIVLSTVGFLNVVILTLPRAYQAMAADGLFFSSFGKLHPRWHSPVRTILLQSGWAIVLCLSGTYEQLLDYTNFGDWLFMAWITVALLRLRWRETPEEAQLVKYRCPLFPVLPMVFLLCSVGILAATILSNPRNALVGAALILAGVPVYALWTAKERA